MLLSDWRVIVRRWYVVLAGVLATVGLGIGTMILVPASYEVKSNVLMLPPPATVEGRVVNPYLDLGGLEGIADALATTMTDTATQTVLTDAGLRAATYTIARDPTLDGPVEVLQVEAPNRSQALAAQQRLIDLIPVRLRQLQLNVGVSSKTLITSTVLTQDSIATAVRKSQIRALLVAVAAGLMITYLAAALVDGALLTRRRNGAAPLLGSTPKGSPLPSGPRFPPMDIPDPDGVDLARRLSMASRDFKLPWNQPSETRGPGS